MGGLKLIWRECPQLLLPRGVTLESSSSHLCAITGPSLCITCACLLSALCSGGLRGASRNTCPLPPAPCNSAANYCWKDNPRHYTWRGAEWLFKLWSKTEIVICAGMPGSCACARYKLTKCICPFPVEHFKIFPCFELHAPISWSLLWQAANVNLILCCLGISTAVTSLSMSSSTCTHVEIKIYPWKHHCKKGQLYNRVISCFLTELIL